MSFNFLKQSSSANGKNVLVNMSPLSDFFERVKFYEWTVKFFLTAKGINVPGIATMSHTNILRIYEIQMLFSNNIETKL